MKTIAALLILACATVSAKKPEQSYRTFHVPFDTAWSACLRAANEYGVVRFSDKASGTLSFNALVKKSFPYVAGVTVESLGDSDTKVSINPQKERWFMDMGTAAKLCGDFFAAVEAKLKR